MAQTYYDNAFTQVAGDQLPYSLEAEQSVLGAVLVDSGCLALVLDNLRPGAFYRPEHERLFEIMLRLFTTGQPVDFVTVLDLACREEVFPSESEAKIYLASLAQIVPSTRNVEAYAAIVREKSYLRALISAGGEIVDHARSSGEDVQTIMDSAEQKIFDIRAGRHGSKLVPIDAIILDIYDRLQRLGDENRDEYLGIPTGFGLLDRVMTGLNRSDLILLAARPGMGKTSFALNIATNVAMKSGKKVAIFSLEMSKEQLVERIMSGDALVAGNKMRTGELTTQEWVRLAGCSKELAKAKILVDDTAAVTVPEMKARLRRVRDVDLVIIDYLQLMSSGSRSENRVQVVSEITRSLKVMAKEMNVPVIVLSQLSRQPETRSDHRPMLSDLRESGSIEQDADLVLFLYRDFYYNQDIEEPNVAECIVAKNRHGETGTVKLVWDGAHTRFTNLEYYRDEE
ncbi:MAG: replicative DNA helicase [Oscillospiraceae bacterium]|nr:replicative DNA helicase [Oscillospiraceae bacterium]